MEEPKQDEPKQENSMVKTPEELAESRARLEALVQDRKRRVEAGEVAPPSHIQEIRAEMLSKRRVISVGDAVREALPKLEATMKAMQVFATGIKEKIASLQPETCIEHPEQELPVNEDGTIGHSWNKQTFTVVYDPCPKCSDVNRIAAERARWLDRGIPNKVVHATFDNYDTAGDAGKQKALAKFKSQVKKGGGFIIAVGKWGTGKTHLAAATLRAMGGGIFITMHDLVGELRQSYAENSGQDTMVERYQKAKVLALDEVSIDVFDPSSRKGLDIPPILYRVLGYRHDHDLLTVLTSNDELEVVLQILGPKLRDRMRENYTVVNFTWESHRQPQIL